MTYLDQYRAMSVEELCDWADGLFLKANVPESRGDPHMTETRNILPFVVDRLRAVERKTLSSEQRDLMGQADRLLRKGDVAESFKLRMQTERMGRSEG